MTMLTEPELRQVADELPHGRADAILYADRDGTIRFWNPAAERIFGFTAAEAIGASLDIIVPERPRERQWTGWEAVIARRRGRTGDGEPVHRADARKVGTRCARTVRNLLGQGLE